MELARRKPGAQFRIWPSTIAFATEVSAAPGPFGPPRVWLAVYAPSTRSSRPSASSFGFGAPSASAIAARRRRHSRRLASTTRWPGCEGSAKLVRIIDERTAAIAGLRGAAREEIRDGVEHGARVVGKWREVRVPLLPELDIALLEIGDDQVVLRFETAVDADLRHARLVDDLLDADRANALAIEKVGRDRQYPLTRRLLFRVARPASRTSSWARGSRSSTPRSSNSIAEASRAIRSALSPSASPRPSQTGVAR